ncbi:MAG: hypothetical protein E6P95_01175 [Candidatus Moraniibacteriota bacterium]|nr:MAG: hypothetical protein E6P95_01175 [Candidatus Moranbacteria bacterium]
MSLKLLLFPTLIILSVVLIIGYIKPDIETILAQREVERVKQGELENVERIGQNIQTLTAFLDQRNDTEKLIKRYYPEKMDQERTLDVINFLAQQSGVVITNLAMIENARPQAAVAAPEVNADPFASAEQENGGVQSAPQLPLSYQARIRVMGAYSSLRIFFDRLYHTDRMRVMNEFSLEQIAESERVRDGQELIPADFLEASLMIDFFYTAPLNAGNALQHDIFKQDTLDLVGATQLVDFVNSPVGDLAPVSSGKSNPFEAAP